MTSMITIRVSPALHARLKQLSRDTTISLNRICTDGILKQMEALEANPKMCEEQDNFEAEVLRGADIPEDVIASQGG